MDMDSVTTWSPWIMVALVVVGFNIVSILCVLFIYFLYPHLILLCIFRIQRYLAGMKTKYVSDGQMTFSYGEKNEPNSNKPSLVFVHGFTGTKDNWSFCFKFLPKDLHMIAVDLPGHGESSQPSEDEDIYMDYMINKLNKLLDLAGLGALKIHIIGISLGGAIAGCYAAKYPERVSKVTLICPAMNTPVDSPLACQLKESFAKGEDKLTIDDLPFLTNSIQGLKKLFEAMCYNKSQFLTNNQLLKGLLTLRRPKLDFYFRLHKVATAHYLTVLAKTAQDISSPSQVIWGKQDQIIDVSGAEMLKANLPNCRYIDIIDKCGHTITLECPELLSEYLLKFIMDNCHGDKKND